MKVDLIARSFNRERFIAEKKNSLSLFCACKRVSLFLSFLSLEKEGFVGVSVVTTTRAFFSQSSVKK